MNQTSTYNSQKEARISESTYIFKAVLKKEPKELTYNVEKDSEDAIRGCASLGVACGLQKRKVQNNTKDIWFSIIQKFSSKKGNHSYINIVPFFRKSRNTHTFQMRFLI